MKKLNSTKKKQKSNENFIIKEVKIYNNAGELIAQSSSLIPLKEKECETCKAEFLILSMEDTPEQYMETGQHEHSIQ